MSDPITRISFKVALIIFFFSLLQLIEILFELSYLFTTEKTDQLILFIQFACNIYIYQPNDSLAKSLVDVFALTMQNQMHEKQVKKVFSNV